jgi:hypothetical protein
MARMLLKDGVYPAETPVPPTRIRHVILTRFNIRFEPYAPPSAEWIRDRTAIFADVCLPSVVNQTDRPASWLIGVDGGQPELVEPLAKVIEPYPWIRFAAQEPREIMPHVFSRELENDELDDDGYLMTTRLDCDDAIALTYVRDAVNYAGSVLASDRGGEDFWISFPYGAQLSDGHVFAYPHVRSHFLTRVVSSAIFRDKGANVMNVNHTRVFEDGRKVYNPMTSFPMWLQNVHGTNLSNRSLRNALELQPFERVRRLFLPGIRV